jgi:cell division septum initiation protein DivIVA
VRTLEQQIRSADFAISRKGYNATRVDEALEAFADEVAVLLAELRKESIRVSALERSLTFAQNGRSSAQPDLAALIVEASDMKAKLLDEARTQAEEIVESAARLASEPASEGDRGIGPVASLARERQIELALEEASAIESAARDLADQIRSEAESDADRVLESARTAASRLEPIDTGTGVDGIELAQHYG